MAFKIPALLTQRKSGPALNPGQESRGDALRRVGISEQDFDVAVARLGFPVGTDCYWYDEDARRPGMTKVVLRRDVDEWVALVRRIAKALR